ncbi:hypothetical protein QWY82_01005 [Simiduia curdlanivorans]|uniref:Uncharacterized protein n=1 Tax=Simiduia curdlanivorans TaxID=1492769 RepID=A0ABV8V620_9GAMM|nr:hypothetical protein [Simiduia curdlanivorans]MDN3637373.1 hypothetical protein [Simiduia curdlanivorans]
MPWTSVSLFVEVSARGYIRYKHQIPASCIESAEYIIQSIHGGVCPEWKPGQTRAPNVYATFGNGKTFNVSLTENFHKQASGVTDYDFKGSLPGIGQGIICLNTSSADLPYNMHLGAVLAVDSAGRILVSNMMEKVGVPVVKKTIESIEVSSVEAFFTDNFGALARGSYALGLLST